MKDRDQSLDVLKGIGMLAVVFGHVHGGLPSRMLYIFHMPLFFIVSGYLFRPSLRWRDALKKYSVRLVVPYLVFLFVLQLDRFYLAYHRGGGLRLLFQLAKALWGGEQLTGRVGVFWFPACLFLTLIAYQWLRPYLRGGLGAGLLLGFATTSFAVQRWAPDFWLPWAANLVPMSLVFFHAGYVFRSRSWNDKTESMVFALALVVSIAYAAGMWWHGWPSIGMKRGGFGWPFLTVFAAFCSVYVLWQLSRRLAKVPLFGSSLATIGVASLVIMYLHQAVQMSVRDAMPTKVLLLRMLLGVCVPLLVYFLVERFRLTRMLLLGR